jgi:hypothetical protein
MRSTPTRRGENEHPAENSTPGRMVREQLRNLCDPEHEDEVEEEFERVTWRSSPYSSSRSAVNML